MNLNRYEIFLKVAEIGNITRAAEILNYTQAGISHAISALEKEAGVTLLIRSSNGVTLTDNGLRLIAPIQALVNEQRNLTQTIYEINNVVAGTLKIGIFTSISTWFPSVMKGFHNLYPDTRFELFSGDYDDITDNIISGRIDCGFLSTSVTSVDKGLLFTPVYDDPMLVLMPPSHPLTAKEALSIQDIKNESFILPSKGSDNDILAVLKSMEHNINARYILNDEFSVMSMVAGGFGITIMPELIYQNFKLNLVARPLMPKSHRTIGVASLPSNKISILTRTFIKYLADTGFSFK